jgi:hypothetical protein
LEKNIPPLPLLTIAWPGYGNTKVILTPPWSYSIATRQHLFTYNGMAGILEKQGKLDDAMDVCLSS